MGRTADSKDLEKLFNDISDLREQLPQLYEKKRGTDELTDDFFAEIMKVMETAGKDWIGRVGLLLGKKQMDEKDGS